MFRQETAFILTNRSGELFIFDMDGTLLRSEPVAVPAFHAVLSRLRRELAVPVPDGVTDEQICGTFGLTHDRIWERLAGRRLTEDEQRLADAWVLEEEVRLIGEGHVRLFDSVAATLKTLYGEGAQLAVASNGQQGYIEAIVRSQRLEPLFAGLYSASGAGVSSKVDLVRQLLADISHERAAMVGDRHSDIEAGRENGLFSIGCAFGFGDESELEGADAVVRSFSEILRFRP